jgi:pimeloyl-ACP methyl ester carboxylesterase
MTTIDHPQLQSLSVRDATVEFIDSGGTGEPLLLIHAGVFSDWFGPLAAEPALRDYRVIRMIRAGYTAGPAPTRLLTIRDHAAHCAELLQALNVSRATIVAHSSGTIIALQLALDWPDLVAALVLSEPPLIDPLAAPQDLEALHAMLGPVIGSAVAAAAAGDVAAGFDTFMRAVGAPDYRDVLTASLGVPGLERAERGCRYFFTDEILAVNHWQFDPSSAAEIRQPVLLVQGAASPPVVHRLITHLAAQLPDAEINTLDRQDHLLPLRTPSAFAAVTTDFTQRHRDHTRTR